MQNINLLIPLNSPFYHRYKDRVISIWSTVLITSAECTRDEEMKSKTKREREIFRKKSRDRQRKYRKTLNKDERNSRKEGDRKRMCKARKEKTSTPEGLAEQRDMYSQQKANWRALKKGENMPQFCCLSVTKPNATTPQFHCVPVSKPNATTASPAVDPPSPNR